MSARTSRSLGVSSARGSSRRQAGIDDGAAACDPLERVDEVGGVHHPALEQVADALAALEQVHRRLDLDVCGEEENSDPRELGPDRARRVESFRRMRRRHAYVDHDEVRRLLAHELVQRAGVARLADDVVAGAAQEAGDPLA
jgi:hypothetical protein